MATDRRIDRAACGQTAGTQPAIFPGYLTILQIFYETSMRGNGFGNQQ